MHGLRSESLPADLQPSTLLAFGEALYVAGHVGRESTRRPALATIVKDRTDPIPLKPTGPYAKVADLFSVAVDGDTITALGRANGGAHANPRWTTWNGTATRVTERPQVFWTFGGEEAGALTGVASTPYGPRIVGSWQGRSALDIAIWRQRDGRWVRLNSAGTPLANTSTLQGSGRSVTSTGTGMVISGSVLELSGGVRQSAAVWVSRSDRDWRLVRLPDPGARSEALAASCAGDVCLIAGHVDGRLAAWTLQSGKAQRVADLPSVSIELDGPPPRAIAASPVPMLAYTSGGRVGVVVGVDRHWATYAGPRGDLADATAMGDRIYLAVRTTPEQGQLWSGDTP